MSRYGAQIAKDAKIRKDLGVLGVFG